MEKQIAQAKKVYWFPNLGKQIERDVIVWQLLLPLIGEVGKW